MRKLVAAALLSTTLALPALAHQGAHHTSGVVKEVTPDRLLVTDQHGKDAAFVLTGGTRYLRDQRPIRREEVTVGERVVVNGSDAGGRLEATVVKVGTAPVHPR